MAKRLYFSEKLYLGESIKAEKLDKLKKKLSKNPALVSVYVITLSKNPGNQLEIYDARQLAQFYYIKYPPCVVGIASGYQEALSVLERMVQECLGARGDCRLKEFLLC